MHKNIFFSAIFIVITTCSALLAENQSIASSTDVSVLEQQKGGSNYNKGLDSNQKTYKSDFAKTVLDTFKAFGLHLYR